MRVLPGMSAKPTSHSPGLLPMLGEFHITLALVAVPSASSRLGSVPMMLAAPFQRAAGLTPATSVAAIAGAATSIAPPAPAICERPPMKSMLITT